GRRQPGAAIARAAHEPPRQAVEPPAALIADGPMKRQSRRPSARVSRPGPALAEEVATAETLHELAIERLQNRLKPSIPGARNSDRARAPDRSSRIGAVLSRRRVRLPPRLHGQGQASPFVSP